MKQEKCLFEIAAFSHNGKGESIRIIATSFANRTEVVNTLTSLGIDASFLMPYKIKKERAWPVSAQKIYEITSIVLGEFLHDPHISVKKLI